MRAAFNPLVLDGAFNGGLANAVREVGAAWQGNRRQVAAQDREDRLTLAASEKAAAAQKRSEAFSLAQLGLDTPDFPQFAGVTANAKAKEDASGRSVHQIRNADGSEVPVLIDKRNKQIIPLSGGGMGLGQAGVQAEGKPVANHVIDEVNRQVDLAAVQAGELVSGADGFSLEKPAEYEQRRKTAFLRAGIHPDNLQPLGPNNPYGIPAPAGRSADPLAMPDGMQDPGQTVADPVPTTIPRMSYTGPVPVRPESAAPLTIPSGMVDDRSQARRIAAFGRPDASPSQQRTIGIDEARAQASMMAQDPQGAEALVAAAITEYGMTRAQAEQFIAQALR